MKFCLKFGSKIVWKSDLRHFEMKRKAPSPSFSFRPSSSWRPSPGRLLPLCPRAKVAGHRANVAPPLALGPWLSVDIWERNKELIRKRTDIGEHFTREIIQSIVFIFLPLGERVHLTNLVY